MEELREQIKIVTGHDLGVAWESYVHETFAASRGSDPKRRQRSVALALPDDEWVTKELATDLTGPLIREYARAIADARCAAWGSAWRWRDLTPLGERFYARTVPALSLPERFVLQVPNGRVRCSSRTAARGAAVRG